MNDFLLITLKSTLCLSVLYGLYALLLKRQTSFLLNRLTLLFIMTVSLAIPMMQKPFALGNNAAAPVWKMEIMHRAEKMEGGGDERTAMLPESAGDKETAAKQKTFSTESVIQWLPAIYFAGMSVSLMGTLLSLLCVLRIVAGTRKENFKGQKIRVSRYRINSFTFAGWIVLSETDFQQHADEIVTHEAVHRRMAHYLDVCLMNVLTILHWFNPLAWALRKELKSVHEYEADCHTLNRGIDAAKYQLLLIKKTAGASRFAIASSFAQSNIKKRIIMMNKKINPKMRWRVLILIPMTALLTQAFARREPDAKQYSAIPDMYEPTLQTTGDDAIKSKPSFDKHPAFVVSRYDTKKSKNGSDSSITIVSYEISKKSRKTRINITSDSKDGLLYATIPPPHDSLLRAEEKEAARKKFTDLENTVIRYNNQEMTLKEGIDKLTSFIEKRELNMHFIYFIAPGDDVACRMDIHLPEIDRKQPQMYYFIDGKWWWNWNNDATLIQSIETLEPDAAVKRFGQKAANGAIVMKTSVASGESGKQSGNKAEWVPPPPVKNAENHPENN
jgi:hypothetical protein